jgi:hypothetical protein
MSEIMCSFSDENRVVFLRLLWVLTCGETPTRIRLDGSWNNRQKSPLQLKTLALLGLVEYPTPRPVPLFLPEVLVTYSRNRGTLERPNET